MKIFHYLGKTYKKTEELCKIIGFFFWQCMSVNVQYTSVHDFIIL